MLVYSDYPVFFDADSAAQFTESKKAVSLYILELKTKYQIQIAIAAGQRFFPEWIDDFTIEYNNPGGGSRLTFAID